MDTTYDYLLGKTREEIHEERKEFNLIIKKCNEIGFDYVLVPRSFSTHGICFGSTLPREVLPVKGKSLTPFMRCNVAEPNSKIGPGSYSLDLPKILQPNISGFIPKAPRIMGPKSIYLIEEYYETVKEKPVKKAAKPFGFGTKVKRLSIDSKTPGVGTYNIAPSKKIRYRHSFGGEIQMINPVQMICEPQHLDKCQNCGDFPIVDYWKNFDEELVLCRACMEDEKEDAKTKIKNKEQKVNRLKFLNESYTLVRYCGFYHRHENTTAKVRLFHPKEIVKKFRREHYLSQFPIKTSRAMKEEKLEYA